MKRVRRVRLSNSATQAIPRALLFAVCAIYVLTGLFGRDPWKNEDAEGFGVIWTMATGHFSDWLLPNIVGKPIYDGGPLFYWLGAIFVRLLSFLNAPDAARVATAIFLFLSCVFIWHSAYFLGKRAEVEPFEYALGGSPSSHDYARTLGDGALLILLACFGLTARGHETSAEIALLALLSFSIYSLVLGIDKPKSGWIAYGIALGLMSIAGNPVLPVLLWLATWAILLLNPTVLPVKGFLKLSTPILLVIALSWPVLALIFFPEEASSWLRTWLKNSLLHNPIELRNYFHTFKNLLLFAWPAWPLALWSLYSWRDFKRAPHILFPLSIVVALLAWIIFSAGEGNRYFLLLLPPLALIATFGLPLLKRGAINAIDWFALGSFTLLSAFVWLVWFASLTRFPAPLAANLYRLLPGFEAEFHPLIFSLALAATLAWLSLAYWRIRTRPKVLWRGVVLSSAGTTLMWILLMTLWLPVLNYGRTYRDVALQIAARLPEDYQCIRSIRVGYAQLASFAYFGNMRFGFGQDDCDILLRQDTQQYSEPRPLSPFEWKFIWEGHRPADRDERFRLYILQKRTHHPRHHKK